MTESNRAKPIIELFGSVGLGLIVELPTGVLYSNQSGGFSCLHPMTEGAFLPIGNDCTLEWELLSPARSLTEFFEGPKHGGAGAVHGLDLVDADFIDSVLSTPSLPNVIRVDRARLSESHEAWVRVLLLGEENNDWKIFQGLGPYPRSAVLVWGNSD